jgi:hypothetical protein
MFDQVKDFLKGAAASVGLDGGGAQTGILKFLVTSNKDESKTADLRGQIAAFLYYESILQDSISIKRIYYE